MDSSSVLIEEQKLQVEPKYRAYMANIDKALKNFEYSSEWADLISALGKLNKAISSNTQYQVIPRRIKISKRLAQCMHPALPSGVHLKALETYDVIFSKTGSERLATELFIYSSGLFPLLGYAAMNVRPTLLGIYEKFFVPLGDKLRPALSGFLSGVIPGYEAGLDHFERTNSLLNQVCAAVDPAYFYTCLWECVSTNASIRLPAISYVLDHFNRKLSMTDQLSLMGKNHAVLMAGLCACLNDPVILVQRNTLEFLLIGFPMHTTLLSAADFTRLVTNGLNTILRRDMSLNRRLYAWLLGSEVVGHRAKDRQADSTLERATKVASYFDQHSKEVLIRALRCTLKQSLQSKPVDLTPYKILVSLLDKVEIGPVVLDHVLCDVIRTMANARGNDEVVKSANLLFATFDPAYIWNFMTVTYGRAACGSDRQQRGTAARRRDSTSTTATFVPEVDSGEPCLVEVCILTEFLLESISLEMYHETTRLYLPRVFLAIVQMLTACSENLAADEVTASLRLCMKIVSRVQPMIQSPAKVRSRLRPMSEGAARAGASAASGDDAGAGGSLEKSKSDSKINQTDHDDEPIRRSHSNHAIKKSPKKTKKSKSFTKLLELDKDISATVDPSMPSAVSTPDLDLSQQAANKKAKSKRFSPSMKLRNLKGRSTPDIKTEDSQKLDAQLAEGGHSPVTPTPPTTSADTVDDDGAEPLNETSVQAFSIVEQCIKQFEEFYHIYVSRHVLNVQNAEPRSPAECAVIVQLIGDSSPTSSLPPTLPQQPDADGEQIVRDTCPARLTAINQMFETLTIKDVSRAQRLHILLHQTLSRSADASESSSSTESSSSSYGGVDPSPSSCDERTEKAIYRLMNLKLSEPVRQSVRLASSLLVEMSTFPNYSQTIATDPHTVDIPAWLKVLALVACYARCDRDLQLCTVATLFDLIALIRSQMEHSTNPGVTFVVMIPLLHYGHVHYLEHRTRCLQVITSTLWDHLGHAHNDPSHISGLLYQLNSSIRSGLIETVIGHRIANTHDQWSDDGDFDLGQERTASHRRPDRIAGYKAERLSDMRIMCAPPAHTQFDCAGLLGDSESQRFRKFELLWEYGRDNQNASAAGFERTLMTVFDQLALPYHLSIRTFVTKWLQESLLRGDMHRLVCPLMRIMFAAGTKRISVKHAHLIRREAVERFTLAAEGDEAAAAAADAAGGDETDGEVSLDKDVCGISSEDGNIKYHMDAYQREKKRSPMRQLQKKFFGVTIGTKNKTSNYISEKSASPVDNATASQNISLIVNPLDSSSDIDAWESETGGSPVGSVPTVAATVATVKEDDAASTVLADESLRTQSMSVKEDEYYSSCEEETDESYSETDSETRGDERADRVHSMSSAITAHAVDIKRFSGDCERVTEMLSQHDRTKNRKQYQVTGKGGSKTRLTVDRTDGNVASASADETQPDGGLELCAEASTPAEEYFNSMTSTTTTTTTNGCVESLVSDLATGDDEFDQSIDATAPSDDVVVEREPFVRSSKHHRRHRNTSEGSPLAGKASSIVRDSSKRLSSASKTSSDSNRSRRSERPTSRRVCEAVNDSLSGGSDAEPTTATTTTGEDRHNFDSVDSGVVVTTSGLTNPATSTSGPESAANTTSSQSSASTTTTTNTTTSTATTEPTRKETPQQISWNKTQETVENSKKNADILRRTAAERDGSFLRRTNLSLSDRKRHFDRLHPFHTHMLLYYGVYDTKQVLYSFQTLRNIIACDCRTFLYFSMTTSVPTAPLRQLLVRHRKSIFGKGFTGSILNTEFSQAYRGCMYLDVLFTVCLYYARSFFQKEAAEMNRLPTADDIGGNCKIQLASVELLTLLCTELITIVKDMGKQLACYIFDLLAKCKLQKIILHCILSCVHSFQSKIDLSFTEQILAFNELSDERLHAESLQIQLLRLLSSVIRLEYEVTALRGDDVPVGTRSPNPATGSGAQNGGGSGANGTNGNGTTTTANGAGNAHDGSPTRLGPSTPTNVKYLPNCPISQQPMFLSAVLKALQSDHLRPLHSKWTNLITSSLNCFTFGSLTNIVISVIHQLCANVDQISRGAVAAAAAAAAATTTSSTTPKAPHIPPDYVVAQVHAITVLCHYCLLDTAQPASLTHLLHQSAAVPQPLSPSISANTGGQLLHNIVHAILSPPLYTEQQQSRNAQLLAARNAVLSHLPVIVASVARLWDTPIGQTRTVRQQIVEFLSPVFRQHGTNFLAAVSVTWQERTEPDAGRKSSLPNEASCRALPQACAAQLGVVRLVSSIRVMSMDTFVQTLHQVVKSPPNIHHPPIGLSIEVSALELFYFYMRQTPPIQLADCWPSLLLLLRDGIGLMPSAQFVILAVLNEFVLRSPQMPFTDRKDLRDLHDVTARLVEALSNVAGARLEQTTWLRRNLAVKEDLPHLCLDGSARGDQLWTSGGVGGGGASSGGSAAAGGGNQAYSVQAQSVMAAVLANLLDVAYGYQDKDKVVTIITTLMYNITPYLKNHTVRNIPSFQACSQLLANLSAFQYTRKAWRKDMVDLLLDPSFFQMDISCLPSWKTILDNLMTYDNTTFRELMGRVSLTQTGGLNIFTSREQEYEQRALLLKRLAFVIFCSERNQYHKYMPEIQEQLANSLRLPSVVPAVQAAVFLCFRVLLLRMSPDHVTSLWPTIIAEMVQVFLAIEQELKSDSEDFSQQLRSLPGMDAPLTQHHLNHWRTVQLETSKLLELGCVLPATNLPHFQMYRWAFVGSQYETQCGGVADAATNGAFAADLATSSTVFIPHVQRIARLMDLRYTTHSPTTRTAKGAFLTLTCQTISELQDLYAFFSTLGAFWPPANFDSAERDVAKCLAEIETVLAADFLEKMPAAGGSSGASSAR